jgi:acyl dehydratase
MIEIANVTELRAHVGREIAISDWVTVTQEQIARFADVTDDHQWIHLDQERAARESPYGTTIAHGFLSLALIGALVRHAVSIGGQKLSVNYGLNRVRFTSAVPSGARIRARVTPMGVEDADGSVSQVTWKIVVEREGAEKPCLVAEWIVRYYAT